MPRPVPEPPLAHPEPNIVRYNDWRQVALPPIGAFIPSMAVSVIMPSYQTPAAMLARTLAALERQTYPRHLFEVVFVDDGSNPPLRLPNSPLDIKIVRQERRGFGIARARNRGARAARHDILLFLDSDMLVEADWLLQHARWHHAVADALTVGRRANVAADDLDAHAIRAQQGDLCAVFAGRSLDPPSADANLLRTNGLTTRADDLFRVVDGADFGIGKAFYWAIGGTDESFSRWGMEDIELGYRAFAHGGLLVPMPVWSWHQGRYAEGRADKDRSYLMARGKAAHLIAHPDFRDPSSGRVYAVPQVVATIAVGAAPPELVVGTVACVLADSFRDVVARVELSASDDGETLAWLRDVFDPDPRVQVAPSGSALAAMPAAAHHVELPAGVMARNPIGRLLRQLGCAVAAQVDLGDGRRVVITRAWALHRALRTGKSVSQFGDERQLSAAALGLRRSDGARDRVAASVAAAAKRPPWRFALARLLSARGAPEVRGWLRWVLWRGWRRLTPNPCVPTEQRSPRWACDARPVNRPRPDLAGCR